MKVPIDSSNGAHAILGLCLMQMGKLDEARAALTLEPSATFRPMGLAVLEQRANNRAAARDALDALVSQVGDAALYQQAQVMAQWQRPDDALALLQKARRVGDSGLTAIASDPLLDPIARDPRFKAFVRELGFG